MKKLTETPGLRIRNVNPARSPFYKIGGKQFILSCFLFYLLSLFLLLGEGYSAQGDVPPPSGEKGIPHVLLFMDFEEESYAIIVEKSTQRLFLYGVREGKVALVKSFPCSTGEHRGDKNKPGDKRTPEGIYFFTRVFEKDELDPRYGVRAFVLDYPNFFDRVQLKEGNGIWLHGTNKPLVPNDSQGCIAMNNQDLLDLSHFISLYRTPLIVVEKIEYLPLEAMQTKERWLRSFITEWITSWENKELTRYLSCYAKDFRARGMDWLQWKRYKEGLLGRKGGIKVEVSGVQGFAHDHYHLVIMKQRYYSDLLKSEGIKRLYVRDKGEALEIVGEQWNPLRGGYVATSAKPEGETTSFVPADETRVEEERIKTFIERWRGLWERKDLDAYMRCYSEDFKTQGMDTRGWKKLKRFLMNKYKNIKVIITGAEIKVREGGEAEVSFSQRYQTECYSDEGAKTLHLKKEKGEWKIVSEQWRPL